MKSDKEEIAKLFELEKLLNERMSTSLVNHMGGVRFMPPEELREAIEIITKESREALKEVSMGATSNKVQCESCPMVPLQAIIGKDNPECPWYRCNFDDKCQIRNALDILNDLANKDESKVKEKCLESFGSFFNAEPMDCVSIFLGQWTRPPHLETPIAIETYKIVNVEPCPYCEADAANDMETDNGKQKFLVYCSNEEGCGACGPWANTREEAEELWNSVARDVMYAKAKRTAEIKLNHMK